MSAGEAAAEHHLGGEAEAVVVHWLRAQEALAGEGVVLLVLLEGEVGEDALEGGESPEPSDSPVAAISVESLSLALSSTAASSESEASSLGFFRGGSLEDEGPARGVSDGPAA